MAFSTGIGSANKKFVAQWLQNPIQQIWWEMVFMINEKVKSVFGLIKSC